jgi:hypothetical protein
VLPSRFLSICCVFEPISAYFGSSGPVLAPMWPILGTRLPNFQPVGWSILAASDGSVTLCFAIRPEALMVVGRPEFC